MNMDLQQSGTKLRRDVVVLDDEEGPVAIIAAILKPLGWTVTSTWNKQEFLDAVRSGQRPVPDLVITDITCPRMNGLEFLRAFKSDPKFQHVPVIVSSAVAEGCRDEARRLGASGSLEKPWYAKDFLRLVDEVAPSK